MCKPCCPLLPPAPSVQFEQASYQVREPPGPDGVEVLSIKVFRRGDQDRTSKVRCSTRDGSAQSGIDYNPKSRVLKFTPGQYLVSAWVCLSLCREIAAGLLVLRQRDLQGLG